MTATLKGRNDLLNWEHSKPQDFFISDTNLQHVLCYYMGEKSYQAARGDFNRLGKVAATLIDEAAKTEDRIGNHPRLARWTGLGERVEQVDFHPNHDRIGREVWQSGVMALQARPGHTVQQMALYYLLAHNGEMGHLCSLACTSGLIRALQQAADDTLRDQFLPPLLDSNYDTMEHGAQFLTEIQGGSDVGANVVQAAPVDDGTWRITGEKWFCSNINADQFLMTARATDASGTRGLGLFLVPRMLDDGTTNGFYIRRLKDKLGTRTLASAELDFDDAVAYPVGTIERGFKTVVELVLNTSRLMNAVACAGIIRRAYIEAGSYACHREAFGQLIADYPMVQEAVADIMAENYAATASSFYTAHLLDNIETGRASDQDEAVYRLLVNINKYITSIAGTHTIHRAIEVLGGNGAIELFSILPRLYRDMMVLESWEGTHNVLAVQVMRDIQKYGLHEAFFTMLNEKLVSITAPSLTENADHIRLAISRLQNMLQMMMSASDSLYAQAHARRFVDLAARIAQATLLLSEAQWEYDQSLATYKPQVATYFINQHLRQGYDPMQDDTYIGLLAQLITAL